MEIVVWCRDCGASLEASAEVDKFGDIVISVSLCETCVEEACDEAKTEEE